MGLSPANVPYLDELAASAGIPKAEVVDIIITEARTRGWSITVAKPSITAPDPCPEPGTCVGGPDPHYWRPDCQEDREVTPDGR
jgi:hypothetical protein